MPIQSPRDFFIYELSSMHSAERHLVTQLSEMEQKCHDPQVKRLFSQHSHTTQQQLSRLEECFRILGAQRMTIANYTVECMKQDVQAFLHRNPPQELVDLFCLGAAARAEHYEIASYMGLLENARALSEPMIVSILEESLAEERSAAHKVEELDHQIGSRLIQSMTP